MVSMFLDSRNIYMMLPQVLSALANKWYQSLVVNSGVIFPCIASIISCGERHRIPFG